MTIWRWLSSVHGYLGVLSLVGLIHPALLLRSGKPLSRRARLAMVLATLLSLAVFASGIAIYGAYREHVKRGLFGDSIRAGLFFETKEHLAVLVVSFALGGCVAALLAPRSANASRRAAAVFYAVAALVALIVVSLGTYVSGIRGF